MPSAIIQKQPGGFVGFSNLPHQHHYRSVREGFTFTLMLVGEPGVGKATLINSLFNCTLIPSRKFEMPTDLQRSLVIRQISTEFEEKSVRLTLNVIDTPGFGDFINNDECWQPIIQNIEARYDDYMEQEHLHPKSKVVDNRVHACLYFIPATQSSLRQLDIETMRRLAKRVNLIPVIAKSDVMGHEELKLFKERIMEEIRLNDIRIFLPPNNPSDDVELSNENILILSRIPFAIIGSINEISPANQDSKSTKGRVFPWGTIDIHNETHCDFIKLRQMLIRNHMVEIKNIAHHTYYEGYRTEKLKSIGREQEVFTKEFNMIEAYERQRRSDEERLQKMEHDMNSVFQAKVREKEMKLKQSEEELKNRHREMRDTLERQRQDLEERKKKLEAMLQQMGPNKQSTPEKTRKKGYFK